MAEKHGQGNREDHYNDRGDDISPRDGRGVEGTVEVINDDQAS
jgi:hypothetical protein